MQAVGESKDAKWLMHNGPLRRHKKQGLVVGIERFIKPSLVLAALVRPTIEPFSFGPNTGHCVAGFLLSISEQDKIRGKRARRPAWHEITSYYSSYQPFVHRIASYGRSSLTLLNSTILAHLSTSVAQHRSPSFIKRRIIIINSIVKPQPSTINNRLTLHIAAPAPAPAPANPNRSRRLGVRKQGRGEENEKKQQHLNTFYPFKGLIAATIEPHCCLLRSSPDSVYD
ncbi:hypothetical protein VTL71DRAFT_2662 [Oculimacula yallundae]|uniref:Uncharacterized protein n=1 Tax=Oculimacula yallundae TaxID=86028 RepID=A0ABR4CAV9_9HELO